MAAVYEKQGAGATAAATPASTQFDQSLDLQDDVQHHKRC
jgi:hypothetical protein